jgi:hypothetical protein
VCGAWRSSYPESPNRSIYAPDPFIPPINISNNSFVFNYRGGDVYTETHIHIHEPPKVQERVTIRREVETRPPRRTAEDPCDQGQREHEERVRRWKQFPRGH